MSLAEVAALVEVDLLIRALAVGVTLPPLDIGRPAVLEKMCLRGALWGPLFEGVVRSQRDLGR